jgi:hemolysin III
MSFYHVPPDGGVLYAETNMRHFFPEPLNAFTSVFFLILAIYWTFKLKGKGKKHTFLSIALILLYIGGIGGTIYHGLRQWSFFIIMDWLPIVLLCIMAGVYFLARVTRWYYAVILIVAYISFQIYARSTLIPNGYTHLYLNINYAILATIVLFPVLAFLTMTQFKNGKWVWYAFVSFVLALTCRVIDMWYVFESGTHFLWHVFGAVAAYCMFHYIYLINETQPDAPKA